MKAIIWNEANQGMTFEYGEIPADMGDECKKWHENLLEAAAESSEELMDKYLSTGRRREEEIIRGVRARTLTNDVVPVFCGSAFKNKGVQAVLDGVIVYLPSPADVPAIKGTDETGEQAKDILLMKSHFLR